MMKVLIVEDDPNLGDTLVELLSGEKYEVELVTDGKDGLFYAESGMYDVILLDVMLPGMNGFEIVKALRTKKNNTPVLMLTARGDAQDKVKGLDMGADDYLTKPFIPEELFARLRALTRRSGDVIMDTMDYEDLSINISSGELVCGEKKVRLPSRELTIMKLLMANKGVILPKDDLIMKAWDMDSEASDNNVEVYISFLRKKLKFLDSRVKISTARKIGYYLEKPDD